MNDNINLCEILKGHKGETFYSPIYGNMTLIKVDDRYPYPLYFDTNINNKSVQTFNSDGKPDIFCDECLVFPSKDQRDWNKWIEEQNSKVPKTWSELVKENKYRPYFAEIHIRFNFKDKCAYGKTPIEKSVAALLKIYQLIEVGYGGNVSYERVANYERENVFKITSYKLNNRLIFKVIEVGSEYNINHIMFHTKEQAEEFLKYPENIQLIKDYFMI